MLSGLDTQIISFMTLLVSKVAETVTAHIIKYKVKMEKNLNAHLSSSELMAPAGRTHLPKLVLPKFHTVDHILGLLQARSLRHFHTHIRGLQIAIIRSGFIPIREPDTNCNS